MLKAAFKRVWQWFWVQAGRVCLEGFTFCNRRLGIRTLWGAGQVQEVHPAIYVTKVRLDDQVN